MASIRRTLSPYHDRPYHNGVATPFSPTHKLLSNPKHSFPLTLPRFISGLIFRKHPRKYQTTTFIKSFYRLILCFFVGFLLGLTPYVDVPQNPDFSLDINPPVVQLSVEKTSVVVNARQLFDYIPRRLLIVVTPTYNRALQAYYLNRLGQVLKLVPPPVLWVVVEMNLGSVETTEILRNTGVMYRHLVCNKNSTDVKDRGVHQRNVALEHIRSHKLDGIVYFADDDNIYSLELFESVRGISRFGTWPVAMLEQSKNKAILEGPVCNGSQVVGWHTNEKSKRLRRFHIDMSGFAFNSTILWDPKRWKRPLSDPIRQLDTVNEGFQETTFIEQVVEDESQMEGILPGCSRIMNWHLHLEARKLGYPRGWQLQKNLDAVLLVK